MRTRKINLDRLVYCVIYALLCLFFSGICFTDAAEDKVVREPKNALSVDVNVFYRLRYAEFLDGLDAEMLVRDSKKPEGMSKTQSVFFAAGFIRGLLEYNTLKTYKKNSVNAFTDNFSRGTNAGYEMLGWKEGCKVGSKQGDMIVQEYAEYLRGRK